LISFHWNYSIIPASPSIPLPIDQSHPYTSILSFPSIGSNPHNSAAASFSACTLIAI